MKGYMEVINVGAIYCPICQDRGKKVALREAYTRLSGVFRTCWQGHRFRVKESTNLIVPRGGR